MRVLKGTDPELFVLDGNNKPVPAHRLGYGDKFHKTEYAGGKAFRDGYAIEINVLPAFNWYTVAQRVQAVTRAIQAALPEKHTLVTIPTVGIDLAADLADAPPDVLIFGCDPSMDAYTGKPKMPNLNGLEHAQRYAGGHLHFSGEGVRKGSKHWSTRPDDAQLFVRMMDAYVALPFSVLFARDAMWQRRQYYGQAGEYRHQLYPNGAIGIEYRTLGPEVFNHPALVNLAFGVGEHLFQNYHYYRTHWDRTIEPYVQDAVNKGEDPEDVLESFGGIYSARLIKAMAEDMPFMGFHLAEAKIGRADWWDWTNAYIYGR